MLPALLLPAVVLCSLVWLRQLRCELRLLDVRQQLWLFELRQQLRLFDLRQQLRLLRVRRRRLPRVWNGGPGGWCCGSAGGPAAAPG